MSQIKPVGREKPERRRPRTPNPEARRRLMEAAARLIRKEGFPALRIDEIADEAGLSVGTFYLYFDGKADLFVSLVLEYTEQLQERLQAAYRTEGGPVERLMRGLEAYLDFVEENERGFLYFRDAGGIDTTVGRLATWAFEQHAKSLQPLLEEAMAAGQMRRYDSGLLAQAMVGLNQHMAGHWLEQKQRYTREEIMRFTTTLLGVGVAPA